MYKKRKSLLKNEREQKMFQEIDWRFMSEESDDSDTDVVLNHHKLPWRSRSMSI